MKNLMIVESPNKCAKVKSFLGDGWEVAPSKGHVRDLPTAELGISADDYALQYEVTEARTPVISALRHLVKGASHVVLATDPDREGEAIAWHLKDELGIAESKYSRVTFTAIDGPTIAAGMAAPRKIDLDRVHAQEARRAVDRLVGYKVSPLLWDALGSGASAGRVQSPAVRLVYDRDCAIANFKPVKHYGARLEFDGGRWAAEWDTKPHLLQGQDYVLVEDAARKAASCGILEVVSSETRQVSENPPPPFKTSTLMRAASSQLKLKSDRSMSLAQQLFEGKREDESGHISYHRTDSVNLSDEATESLRAYAQAQGLKVSEKVRRFKEASNAQAGHEGVRPTYWEKDTVEGSPELQALYALIRNRAIASQLAPATYSVNTVVLRGEYEGKEYFFKATGRVLVDAGWLAFGAVAEDESEDGATGKEGDGKDGKCGAVPALATGAKLSPSSAKVETKMTRAPSRYTEGSLLKKLEDLGIGRPSTFASIIKVIFERGYVVEEKGFIRCTPAGVLVVESLVKAGFEFIDYGFTAAMETQLDDIAEGNATYLGVVKAMDAKLSENIEAVVQSGAIRPQHECPKCQRALRRVKFKTGTAWACSGYRTGDCTHVMDDAGGKPVERKSHPCPECSKPMYRRKGEHGFYWGCSGYADGCKSTLPDAKGKPGQRPKASGHKCPDCGNDLIRRTKAAVKGKGGYDFYGCSGYPKCVSSFGVGSKGEPVKQAKK